MDKPKTHKFIINRPDDETMDITLDGKPIGSYNHDADGWAGMEEAENIVGAIAEILGIEVEGTSDPLQDEDDEEEENE